METATMVREQLAATYQEFITGVVSAAPTVVVGILLLVAGLLIAKIVEWVCRNVLKRAHFDDLMKRLGVEETLGRMGLSQPLSTVVPKILYYLLLVLFLRTVADALQLLPISDAIGAFLSYVPNMVSAFLIVLIGSTVGHIAANAVGTAAENAGLEFGDTLGQFSFRPDLAARTSNGRWPASDRHRNRPHGRGMPLRWSGAGIRTVTRFRIARRHQKPARRVLRAPAVSAGRHHRA